MAKVAYVPYSADYEELFTFCGITLPTDDFGGQTGWDAGLFGAAVAQAQEYLGDASNWEGQDEAYIERLYNLLEYYPVYYWSTEAPTIYG